MFFFFYLFSYRYNYESTLMSLGIFQFCLSFLYCKTLYRDLWMYRWRVLDQIIIFIILLEMLFGYHQIKLLVGRYKFWKDGGFRVFIWVFVYHIMGKLHQLFFLFLVFLIFFPCCLLQIYSLENNVHAPSNWRLSIHNMNNAHIVYFYKSLMNIIDNCMCIWIIQ